MTEHPYAGPNTMVPGEAADDDPFIDKEFCEKCDDHVEPVAGTCPICGKEIV